MTLPLHNDKRCSHKATPNQQGIIYYIDRMASTFSHLFAADIQRKSKKFLDTFRSSVLHLRQAILGYAYPQLPDYDSFCRIGRDATFDAMN